MRTSLQRGMLAIILAGVVLSATACGPGAGEGLLNAYLSVALPITGIALLLVLIFGGGGNPPS